MSNPEDAVIDTIDGLVDWQLSESPAAQVEHGPADYSEYREWLDAQSGVVPHGPPRVIAELRPRMPFFYPRPMQVGLMADDGEPLTFTRPPIITLLWEIHYDPRWDIHTLSASEQGRKSSLSLRVDMSCLGHIDRVLDSLPVDGNRSLDLVVKNGRIQALLTEKSVT